MLRAECRRLRVVGDLTAGVPPVPIPNTEVKPRRADGTARESVWERRSLPALNKGHAEKSAWPFPFGAKTGGSKIVGGDVFPDSVQIGVGLWVEDKSSHERLVRLFLLFRRRRA